MKEKRRMRRKKVKKGEGLNARDSKKVEGLLEHLLSP